MKIKTFLMIFSVIFSSKIVAQELPSSIIELNNFEGDLNSIDGQILASRASTDLINFAKFNISSGKSEKAIIALIFGSKKLYWRDDVKNLVKSAMERFKEQIEKDLSSEGISCSLVKPRIDFYITNFPDFTPDTFYSNRCGAFKKSPEKEFEIKELLTKSNSDVIKNLNLGDSLSKDVLDEWESRKSRISYFPLKEIVDKGFEISINYFKDFEIFCNKFDILTTPDKDNGNLLVKLSCIQKGESGNIDKEEDEYCNLLSQTLSLKDCGKRIEGGSYGVSTFEGCQGLGPIVTCRESKKGILLKERKEVAFYTTENHFWKLNNLTLPVNKAQTTSLGGGITRGDFSFKFFPTSMLLNIDLLYSDQVDQIKNNLFEMIASVPFRGCQGGSCDGEQDVPFKRSIWVTKSKKSMFSGDLSSEFKDNINIHLILPKEKVKGLKGVSMKIDWHQTYEMYKGIDEESLLPERLRKKK